MKSEENIPQERLIPVFLSPLDREEKMKYISSLQKRKGISLIWVALTFLVIFALGGLMLDWAHVFLVGHQLQNVADAAALAGSRWVPDPNSSPAGNTARLKAQEYAGNNYAAKLSVNLNPVGDTSTEVEIDMALPENTLFPLFDDGDIYIGRYVDDSRLFIKNDPYPNAMLVVTRKLTGEANDPLPLLFAPIFTSGAVSESGIQKYAVAKIDNPYGAGVLALGECCDCPGIIFGSTDPQEPALTIFGGGSLYVNSCYNPGGNDGAVDQSGNAVVGLDIDSMHVVGSIDEKFDYPDDTDIHDYTDGVAPEPDPYASLPDAVYSTTPDLETMDASGTYSPGYYSGGIQISNGITVDLQAGDYYLDSVGQAASLGMTGGLITGEGVTLHIIGDADYGVKMNGGDLDIAAPTSGVYADIAIFEKRDPDYDCAQSCDSPWSQAVPMSAFSGNASTNIDGAVYMPHNRLELGGTGDLLMTRTVADRIYIYGAGQKVVDYKGTPKIAQKSYLVE